MFNYRQISYEIIKDLPARTRDIISRRFGLGSSTSLNEFIASSNKKLKKESLAAIGMDYGITRERVRQIEKDGIYQIKKRLGKYKSVFKKFEEKIIDLGGLKREDLYISLFSQEEMDKSVLFLLGISGSLSRFSEDRDFYSFWAIDKNHFAYAKDIVKSIKNMLTEKRQPLRVEDCANLLSVSQPRTKSSLEVSKQIYFNREGVFGLKNWPEINPRDIKDKAYVAFKKSGKPLHFTETAALIEGPALPQTVHNELIKDSRFVLVGRGIYALREWGYEPGEVKEVIKKILLEAGRPLNKQEIIEEVMKRRIVKENTIVQSLNNRKNFKKGSGGEYVVMTS